MEGFANLVSMMDYVVDTKRKRHVTGGLLISMALLFGGPRHYGDEHQRGGLNDG